MSHEGNEQPEEEEKSHILVVDDMATNQALLVAAITSPSIECVTADSG